MATTKKTTSTKTQAKTAGKKTATKQATASNAITKTSTAKAKVVKKTTTSKTTSSSTQSKVTTKKTAVSKPKVEKKVTTKTAVEKKPVAKKSEYFRCSVSGIAVKSEKPNLSENTLKRLKELLLEEREKNLSQAQELAQEAIDLIADREGGDTQFDEESGEGDSVAVERERSLFLSSEAHHIVDQIDSALERMKKGTYGLCTPSSRRISVARLEALPWAEICVDCKAKSERRR